MKEDVRPMGLPELQSRGFEALVREPEVSNAVGFLHLHGTGAGDYMRDCEKWVGGLAIEQIEDKIRRMKLRGEIYCAVTNIGYNPPPDRTVRGRVRGGVAAHTSP